MNKINVLMAYPYLSPPALKCWEQNHDLIDMIVDSGAFTAWKSGKPIHLDDYCRFIDGLKIQPWKYFALDVIGDPAATETNYETMLKRGFKPVPVFTRGESTSVIDDLYKTTDTIAVGGLVQTRQNKAFVNHVMKIINKRKVHLLGFCRQEYLLAHRPTSVDSSSWLAPGQFGRLDIYLGNLKYETYTKEQAIQRPPSRLARNILRDKYGLDYQRFKDAGEWRNRGRQQETMLTTIEAMQIYWYQQDIQKHGVKYFAATAGAGALDMERLIKAKKHWEQTK